MLKLIFILLWFYDHLLSSEFISIKSLAAKGKTNPA
jgi:hypothetical protein